ncbi:MAG TPA: hypothetical protein VGF32_22815 [Streptosporangiaceae bacterium]
MFRSGRARLLAVIGALGLVPLAACATSGPQEAASTPAASAAAPPSAAAGKGVFTAPTRAGNQMFRLTSGTEFTYQGRIVEGGRSKPHSVVFTVSDLTKVVDGVRTVVAWDRDFLEGTLQEQELALFAQDDQGNLWNFGEYPEEWEHGKFTGAPDTWIRGTGGAYGGVHMPAHPTDGLQYVEGRVPAIEFYDISKVVSTSRATCVPAGCYQHVLKVDERSPGQSGHQFKYYAPGVGLVRVGARGGDSKEYLTLTAVRHLSGAALARVRAAVLAMEKRAYRVSKVYRATQPATPAAG